MDAADFRAGRLNPRVFPQDAGAAAGLNHLALGSLLAAFWPVWAWYWARMAGSDESRWGIIALLTALVLLWRQYPKAPLEPSISLFAVVLVAIYACTFYYVHPIVRAAFAFGAIACQMTLPIVHRINRLSIGGLFLLSLPIFESVQFYLGYPLRVLTGSGAAVLLRTAGIPIVRDGVFLVWNDRLIGVDPPCSGVRMLWVATYLALMLIHLCRLTLPRGMAVCCWCVITVVAGNMLRSSSLFYIEAGIVRLPSWAHDAVGVLVFLIATASIVLVGRALEQKAS